MLKKCCCGSRKEYLLWVAFVIGIIPVLVGGKSIFVGDTVTSRMATVYALAHDGTWYIDRPVDIPPNPFAAHTVDKVQTRDGRMMSSKPPVLPFFMTGEYVLLRSMLGWDLNNEKHLRPILQVMIITLVKIPFIVGLVFFALILRMFMTNFRDAALLLLVLALASPLSGYACQLNNHTPAVAALIIALYFGMGIYAKKLNPTRSRFMAFGFFSALVFTLDMPTTIFPAFMGLLLLSRFPRQSLIWAPLGGLPLLLLHFGIMTVITGTPLPVQTQEEMYNFRNSYWRNPIGVDGMNEGRFAYLFHMTFGRFGTFLLFPSLLLGLAGFFMALRDRKCPVRSAVVAAGVAFAIMTTYYVIKTNNYGGAAYGFRWHIGAVPVLVLLAMPAIASVTRSWRWALFLLLFAISLFSAWECWQAPWGASHEWTCRWIFGPVY
jgi:hypothetical protein